VSTVIGNAVRALREAIMQGHLAPGQKLVEGDLAAALEISRPSLREALRALEAERLVELIPNRGPFVASLDRHEVEEIHEIWALLTGNAVYRFVAVADKDDLEAIERALAKVLGAMPRGTVLRRMETINRFFGLILSRAGNAILTEMVGSLVGRINFLRARSLSDSREAERTGEEIRTIARHICSKDAESSRAATHVHIASVCSAALQIHAQPPLEPREFVKLLRAPSGRAGVNWYRSTMVGRGPGTKE
jgi:DNA-binding GntR family transcriptional regulator